MKKKIVLGLLIMPLLFLPSCKKGIDVEKPELEEPYFFKISGDTQVIQQKVTVYNIPPGFIGKMPSEYMTAKIYIIGNKMATILHDFGEWKNFFIYGEGMRLHGIANGARTLDKHGKVVAEAKLSRFADNMGIEVEEFHYSGRKVIFYCKSMYAFGLGARVKETEVKGQREKDYYPVWPVSSF